MNFALIIFRYFPFGGLQRDWLRIAETLRQRGHGVTLICGDWEGDRPSGIEVRVLGRRGWSNHGADRRFAASAVAIACSLSPNAVVGFDRMPGLDICYSAENCFVAKALEERPWFYRLTPRYRARRQMEQAVFGEGSRTDILLLAERQRESYRRHYATDAGRMHLLPPSIARDRARTPAFESLRKSVRTELQVGDDEFLLLALGAASLTKGLDRTFQAVGDLPASVRNRVWLFVAGSGGVEPFQRMADRSNIGNSARFLGARRDIGRLLAGADLLLHPARDECTGTVILEAVVAGLPVLCTANCGFSGHVEKAATGVVLAEPFDQAAMTQRLAGMLDRAKLADWSRNGLRYAESADLYRGTEVAADLIERLARKTA